MTHVGEIHIGLKKALHYTTMMASNYTIKVLLTAKGLQTPFSNITH